GVAEGARELAHPGAYMLGSEPPQPGYGHGQPGDHGGHHHDGQRDPRQFGVQASLRGGLQVDGPPRERERAKKEHHDGDPAGCGRDGGRAQRHRGVVTLFLEKRTRVARTAGVPPASALRRGQGIPRRASATPRPPGELATAGDQHQAAGRARQQRPHLPRRSAPLAAPADPAAPKGYSPAPETGSVFGGSANTTAHPGEDTFVRGTGPAPAGDGGSDEEGSGAVVASHRVLRGASIACFAPAGGDGEGDPEFDGGAGAGGAFDAAPAADGLDAFAHEDQAEVAGAVFDVGGAVADAV